MYCAVRVAHRAIGGPEAGPPMKVTTRCVRSSVSAQRPASAAAAQIDAGRRRLQADVRQRVTYLSQAGHSSNIELLGTTSQSGAQLKPGLSRDASVITTLPLNRYQTGFSTVASG